MWWLLGSLISISSASPIPIDCEQSVREFVPECAHAVADHVCAGRQHNQEAREQCIDDRFSHYLNRCSKTEALPWCQACHGKPEGCRRLSEGGRRHHHHAGGHPHLSILSNT